MASIMHATICICADFIIICCGFYCILCVSLLESVTHSRMRILEVLMTDVTFVIGEY